MPQAVGCPLVAFAVEFQVILFENGIELFLVIVGEYEVGRPRLPPAAIRRLVLFVGLVIVGSVAMAGMANMVTMSGIVPLIRPAALLRPAALSIRYIV